MTNLAGTEDLARFSSGERGKLCCILPGPHVSIQPHSVHGGSSWLRLTNNLHSRASNHTCKGTIVRDRKYWMVPIPFPLLEARSMAVFNTGRVQLVV